MLALAFLFSPALGGMAVPAPATAGEAGGPQPAGPDTSCWTGGSGLPAGTPDLTIHFREASFDPLADKPPADSPASAAGLYILQFEGLIREKDKAALEDIGVWFFDYLTYNAYAVHMDPATADAVAGLEGIRWVGAFPPGARTAPWMEEGLEAQVGTDMAPGGMRTLDIQVLDHTAGWTAYRGTRTAELQETADVLEGAAGEVASIVRAHGGSVAERRGESLRVQLDAGHIAGGGVLGVLEDSPFVGWVEPARVFELHNDVADGIMRIPESWDTYGLKGHDQIVAVADTGIDTGVDNPGTNGDMHADFDNRIKAIFNYAGTAPDDGHGHGTHVAGSVLGNGNASGGSIKGMAPNATLVFQAIMTDVGSLSIPPLSTLFGAAYTQGARIHTNSWGSSDYGQYTSSSRDVDQYMWNNKDFLILFSAGNDGTDGNSDGKVDPDSVGSPATAKNDVTVGASENLRPSRTLTWGGGWPADFPANPVSSDRAANNSHGIAAFSSRGPTDDGRIQPDIVAPGTYVLSDKSSILGSNPLGWGSYDNYYCYSGGTSMSTPLTAGAAALVRQHYTREEGISPSAALLKATLLNGADDITPGQYGGGATQEITSRPDRSQGWGLVNVTGSVHPTGPRIKQYVDDNTGLTAGQGVEHEFAIASPSENATFTLVWTDYPGSTSGSGARLVNNLNMKVTGPGGEQYYGNDFTAPYNDTFDTLNPVEMVFVPSPAVGLWTVNITAPTVPNGPQPYALVVTGAMTNSLGRVEFDSAEYDVISKVNITLADGDLAGAGTQGVTVTSNRDGAGLAVTLDEYPADSGVFVGGIELTPDAPAGSRLLVWDADAITVNYTDAFPAETRDDAADVRDWAPMDTEAAAWSYGNALNLTWNHSTMPRLAGYDIYRSTDQGGPYNLKEKLGVTNSFNDTGLKDGTAYFYVIRANNTEGVGSHASGEFNGTPWDSVGPPVTLDTPVADEVLGGTYEVVYNSTHNDVKNVTFQYYNDSDGDGDANDGNSWLTAGYQDDFPTPFQWDTTGVSAYFEHALFRARAKDEKDNNGAFSEVVTNITVDNSPPEKPDILNQDLYPSIDDLDEITNETHMTLTGRVMAFGGLVPEPNATVQVLIDDIKTGKDETGSTGEFSIPLDLSSDGAGDGMKNITVRAWDRFGNGPAYSEPHRVALDTTSPRARAGADATYNLTDASLGVPVLLNGSASSDRVDASAQANRIVNWTWTFSDLSPKTLYGETARFDFRGVGGHEVKLTVTDRAGNTDGDRVIVTLRDGVDPVANAGADIWTDQDTAVTFNGSTSYDNGPEGIANYTWTFDDPPARGPVEIYGRRPTYIFHVPGTYVVTLTVRDAFNNSNSDSLTLRVNDTEAPVAHAGVTLTVFKGQDFNFNGTSTYDNDPRFPAGGSFTWEFTDGSPQKLTGMTPAYAFTTVGSHTVTLTVEDAAGNTDDDTVKINVLSDVTGPEVVEMHPAPGSEDVPADTDIWVRFDEEVALLGILTGFTLADGSGRELSGEITLSEGGTRADLIINGTLEEGATYTASLDPGVVTDISLNPLGGEVSWNFTTEGRPVEEFISVVDSDPGNGAEDVPVNITVNLTLSRAIVQTILGDRLWFVDGDGEEVAGWWTVDGDTMLFEPDGTLAHSTRYTVTLNNSIGGIPLEEDYVLTFTTEGDPADPGIGLPEGAEGEDPGFMLGFSQNQCMLFMLIGVMVLVAVVAAAAIAYRKGKREEKDDKAWTGAGEERLEWEDGREGPPPGGRGEPGWEYEDVEFEDMPARGAAGAGGAVRRSRAGPHRRGPPDGGPRDRGPGRRGPPGERGGRRGAPGEEPRRRTRRRTPEGPGGEGAPAGTGGKKKKGKGKGKKKGAGKKKGGKKRPEPERDISDIDDDEDDDDDFFATPIDRIGIVEEDAEFEEEEKPDVEFEPDDTDVEFDDGPEVEFEEEEGHVVEFDEEDGPEVEFEPDEHDDGPVVEFEEDDGDLEEWDASEPQTKGRKADKDDIRDDDDW